MVNQPIIEILQEKARVEDHCHFIQTLLTGYSWPEDRKRTIGHDLDRVLARKKDPNLYLGIIGEFSAGKSTFLNCLLQKEVLKTHAVQGTTTIPTYIRYGETPDLEVELPDGTRLYYRKDTERLLDLCEHFAARANVGPDGRTAGGGSGDPGLTDEEAIIWLLKTLTTGEESGRFIKKVTLYYPSDSLRQGMVIIDTPGTDSLTPEHLRLTKDIIRERCDLSLVIIPSEKPATASLLDFLKDQLSASLHRCLFLMTKVELLRKKDRDLVAAVLHKRLSTHLDLENPVVIPAPTLLLLEERKLVEPSGLLDDMGAEDRRQLTSNFGAALDDIFTTLQQESVLILTEKLILLMEGLLTSLASDLDAFEAGYKASNDLLQQNSIQDLDIFIAARKAELASYADAYNVKILSVLNEKIGAEQKTTARKFGDHIRHTRDTFGFPEAPDSKEAGPWLQASLLRITVSLEEQTQTIRRETQKQYAAFGDTFRAKYENLAALEGKLTGSPTKKNISFPNTIQFNFAKDKVMDSLTSVLDKYPWAKDIREALPKVRNDLFTNIEKGRQALGKLPVFGKVFERDEASMDEKYLALLTQSVADLEAYYNNIRESIKREVFKTTGEMIGLLDTDIDHYKTAYGDLIRRMIERDKKESERLTAMRRKVQYDRNTLEARISDLDTVKDLCKKI